MSTSRPRRRGDSSPRNVHVAAAAAPRVLCGMSETLHAGRRRSRSPSRRRGPRRPRGARPSRRRSYRRSRRCRRSRRPRLSCPRDRPPGGRRRRSRARPSPCPTFRYRRLCGDQPLGRPASNLRCSGTRPPHDAHKETHLEGTVKFGYRSVSAPVFHVGQPTRSWSCWRKSSTLSSSSTTNEQSPARPPSFSLTSSTSKSATVSVFPPSVE